MAELLYSKSPLCWLYRSPDWETQPERSELSPVERLLHDSLNLKKLKTGLSSGDFILLRVIYCRSMDAEEWRQAIVSLSPSISALVGKIRFNPVVYHYICISHLTGQKLTELNVKSQTARLNKQRVCSALSALSNQAHENAERLLGS